MSRSVRVILHANPNELDLAVRAAKHGLERTEWPADGIIFLAFGEGCNPPTFAVKRNRASIAVWSQQAGE